MAIEVYIYFNGNCRKVVMFYADVFEAGLQPMLTYGDAGTNLPYPLPEEAKNRVLHTHLVINGSKVMFSDCSPDVEYSTGNNVSVMLNYGNPDEMKAVFSKLSKGGEVYMQPQETFFSKCYGFLEDKFGILWQFNYSPEEGSRQDLS